MIESCKNELPNARRLMRRVLHDAVILLYVQCTFRYLLYVVDPASGGAVTSLHSIGWWALGR